MLPNWNQDSAASLSVRVVSHVAAFTSMDPTDLPPLYDSIDTDALDTIFATGPDGPVRETGKVAFRYAGVRVTVRADGSIDIEEPETVEE